MAHFRAAVFDRDPEYIDRFLIYLKNSRRVPFEVFGFTRQDALLQFLSEKETDLLIVPERYLEEIEDIEGQAKRTIVLTETSDKGTTALPEKGEKVVATGRYQSMPDIIDVLLDVYRALTKSSGSSYLAGITVYGLLSFSGEEARIKGAMALAGALRSSGKILYIEPGRFTGLTKDLPKEKEAGFAEVIYLFKTGSLRLKETLKESVLHTEKADILAAPCVSEDLEMIEEAQWPEFIKAVAEAGGYDTVLLGITDIFTSLSETVQMLRAMYICGNDGPYAANLKVRLGELEQYFRDMGREDLLSKIMISNEKGKE